MTGETFAWVLVAILACVVLLLGSLLSFDESLTASWRETALRQGRLIDALTEEYDESQVELERLRARVAELEALRNEVGG